MTTYTPNLVTFPCSGATITLGVMSGACRRGVTPDFLTWVVSDLAIPAVGVLQSMCKKNVKFNSAALNGSAGSGPVRPIEGQIFPRGIQGA